MSINSRQVHSLALDLQGADRRMNTAARKTITTAAFKIKRAMRSDFAATRRHGHAKSIPAAVNYDIHPVSPSYTWAEIGVDKDGPQGPLGNLLAFGSSNNAPVVDHAASLRREAPIMLRKLAEAAEDSVLGGP